MVFVVQLALERGKFLELTLELELGEALTIGGEGFCHCQVQPHPTSITARWDLQEHLLI